ncbi:hypothetical protein [Dechloromonas denitrificans]|uniref:hypothetical protein n=1 Tax=Dechloromonas denitrificans TaxID=281362 RepID=UPI001CF8A743|nr:hypothetical protein [Dechloromonas denitrificans]UCV05667.1 hypothetical protein KI611_10620 [Dechloromonas denitrificans]
MAKAIKRKRKMSLPLFNAQQSPVKSGSGLCRYIRNQALAVVSLFYGLTGAGYTQTELYKYRLEESKDRSLCVHMTQVFNQNFKAPWDRGVGAEGANPTVFGKPYDQIFERLPEVGFDRESTYEMLLSKFPSSPEFDAVKWKEGMVCYPEGGNEDICHPHPMLVAEIDIDNDGHKEWVVKHSFMFKIPTKFVSDAGDEDYSGEDGLALFPKDGLDLTMPLTLKQLVHGQKSGRQPRLLDLKVALQLRPFAYKGKTYLSAYQIVLDDKNLSPKKHPPYQLYPDREYMNILRVLAGGKRLEGQIIETANTESVCRIRMIMLNNNTVSEGN